MTDKWMAKEAGPMNDLKTSIIDSFLKQAELHAGCETMTGPGTSSGSLRVWDGTQETKPELYPLGLTHGKGIVIGRQEGGSTEYLDPRFRPTQRLPMASQRVVVDARQGIDTSVSRGHFTLVGSPIGIIFVNGVPRRGGGIRPPMNGTLLIEPERRTMIQGERMVVEPGKFIKIRLPNRVEVLISGTL
jgi:hypothetical protein